MLLARAHLAEGDPAHHPDRPSAAGEVAATELEVVADLRPRAGADAELAGDVVPPAVGHVSCSHAAGVTEVAGAPAHLAEGERRGRREARFRTRARRAL